ncbi:hypothetical protein MBCUT_19490 [Methanobrevibacter cuticularis]|uniref:Uncharacterized protein n=1 Tax=Methanobrevibacter cuticularis TaxID=47311 RepID=A0A166CQ90_9EURY|nr:hypothetical protein [Methanobrevibacter cuticularis]KZX14756.1 hypothetical protein MBCUT_19490 [Methanobrevibacter cuticularis]
MDIISFYSLIVKLVGKNNSSNSKVIDTKLRSDETHESLYIKVKKLKFYFKENNQNISLEMDSNKKS